MSNRIKDLISAAAANTGQGDEHWHAGGVDRLYFHDPADINAAGQVDVRRVPEGAADDERYVRVELWVRPELAAEIVGRVTGSMEALTSRLRYEVEAELRARYTLEPLAPAAPEPERVPVVPAAIDVADAARRAELDRLIASQAEDDAAAEDAQDVSDEDDESLGGGID